MTKTKIQDYFFIGIAVIILTLLVAVAFPLISPLVLAGVLAVVFYPLHKRLSKLLWKKEGLSAFLIVLFSVLIILIPLSLIGTQIVKESFVLYGRVSMGNDPMIHTMQSFLANLSSKFYFLPNFDIAGSIKGVFEIILTNSGSIFSGTLWGFVSFFVGLLSFYYFLKDGEKITQSFLAISPLPDKYDDEILSRLYLTINSIVRGSLVVAVLQGLLTGIGFAVFGVPAPVFWGSVAVFGSLIPGLGTAIIIIPAVFYLWLVSGGTMALGLLVWGIFIVGLVDNFIKPKIIGDQTKIHPLFILISIIGGLNFFGPLGFILGPLILSLFFVVLEAHKMLQEKDVNASIS